MHTVPFKLNEDAQVFQAGEYTGFGIRTGVKYKDPKTKEDSWTNYKAAIFAKSQAQIDFYKSALVKGAMVVVSGDKLQVETYDGQNGLQINLKLLNATVQAVSAPSGQAAAPAPYAQQSAPQPQQKQPAGFDSFDDDLPF